MSGQKNENGATRSGKWAAAAAAGLDSGAQLTAMHLALFCNGKNTCWPSVEALAEMSGRDKRTVRRNLATLEEAGVIVRTYRADRSTLYRFPVPSEWSPGATHTPPPPDTHDTDADAHVTPPGGTGVRSGGTHMSGQGGHTCPPEEPLEEPDRRTPSTPPAGESADADERAALFALDEPPEPDRFEEFWSAYQKKGNRKSSKKRWDQALKKRGVTADLLIERATAYVDAVRSKQESEGESNWKRFLKDGEKWLNLECWNDELPDAPQPEQALSPFELMRQRVIEREQREMREAREGTGS